MSDKQEAAIKAFIATIKDARTSSSPEIVKPPRNEVLLGRANKRIVKLTKQRDHWKAEHDKLLVFFHVYPYIKSNMEDYRIRLEKEKRLRELEVTHAALVNQLERLQK